jgi:ABC-type molybdate transport system permease subunit
MAEDRIFLVAVWQTVCFTAAALSIELLLGLGLALLVDSLPRFRGLFRAGMLVPMLVPPIVAAVIWRLMFNPQFGVINGTLRLLGVDTSTLTWTSGETWALASVILVDIWEWTPFIFLVLSAGLQAIPPDPVEAARLDGANAWQVFRDVKLPLLKPAIALAVMLPLHLSQRLPLFQFWIRGRDVVFRSSGNDTVRARYSASAAQGGMIDSRPSALHVRCACIGSGSRPCLVATHDRREARSRSICIPTQMALVHPDLGALRRCLSQPKLRAVYVELDRCRRVLHGCFHAAWRTRCIRPGAYA